MGANHQREIALLCELAEPSHGCITNIGLAHIEGFGGEEGCFEEKRAVRLDRFERRDSLRPKG